MRLRSRKPFIGLISLGAVLLIYLLYGRINKTPEIDFDNAEELTSIVFDANLGQYRGKVGTAGTVSVGEVRKAEYEHRDPKTRRIDRVFGFEELLHERGNEWEIRRPYLNYYQRDFKCYISADEGYVQAESATPTSRPTPKDATFIGNVVVHIVPERSSDVKESFIYLDDIDYISERSLFTTAGPVKFVNEDARMLGKGLQLIYNEDQGRLEFLRVIHLESLRLKRSAKTTLSPRVASDDSPPTSPPGTVTADVTQKPVSAPPAHKQPVDQNEGHYYKCVFSKNVLIETPDEMIFADRFFINNIFFKKSSNEETTKTDTGDTESPEEMGPAAPSNVTVPKESEPNMLPDELGEVVLTCDKGFVVAPMDLKIAVPDSGILDINPVSSSRSRIPKDIKDANGRSILIAQKIDYCASSRDAVAAGPLQLTFYPNDVTPGESNQTAVPVKITAQKEAQFLAAANQAVFIGDCLCTMPQGDPCAQQDYTLSAPKLTVYLPEDQAEQPSDSVDILAAGPVELVFYVDMNDSTGEAAKEITVPAKVTAQRQATFLSASNQVVFEGDCSCAMNREGLNLRREYTLSAPRLTVDLPEDKTRRSAASARSIEHLTADGGLVRLSSITTAVKQPIPPEESSSATQGKVLGGIELKCAKFEYDTPQQLSLATGPGLLKFYNSDESASKSSSAPFDLEKPCWAFVENFETLEYLLEPNLIIADAGPYGALLINYYPIVNDNIQEDRLVTATAAHVETALTETPDAQAELSTLTATGGITYEDRDNRFIGSRLFHDQRRSLITVRGDEVQPCLFNGVLQDWIEYDLITGKVKTGISTPGVLLRRR